MTNRSFMFFAVLSVLLLVPMAAQAQHEEPTAVPPPSHQPAEPAAQIEPGTVPEGEPVAPMSPGVQEPGTIAPPLPHKTVSPEEIEARIAQLEGRIASSKTRLKLLATRVLEGSLAGAKAVLVHRNEMGSSFRLVKAVYALDGAPIYNRADDTGDLAEQDEIELFNGYVVPGDHSLSVSLEHRGHGYGIFSYLKGYRFKVRSNHNFTVEPGKTVQVRVTAFEKGNATTPLEERPDIRYVERVDNLGSSTSAPPPPPPPEPEPEPEPIADPPEVEEEPPPAE